MAWAERDKSPLAKGPRTETPEGLWRKCDECQEIILREDFAACLNVCPKCGHHFPLGVAARIMSLVDEGSFSELDKDLVSHDPLKFTDSKPYATRLKDLYKKTGHRDAFVTGSAAVLGHRVQLGVFNFEFLGGSMGAVVGEKIARQFRRSAEHKEPSIIVTSSGGARMQEGIVSLMQMAKTCAALSHLRDHGVPFISVLTHPTTGGVAASFAMLGDINIAEPKALIGFAGPRVIQQTIRAQLPEGFQTAEFLLQHGMVDMICPRDCLRTKLGQLLGILKPH